MIDKTPKNFKWIKYQEKFIETVCDATLKVKNESGERKKCVTHKGEPQFPCDCCLFSHQKRCRTKENEIKHVRSNCSREKRALLIENIILIRLAFENETDGTFKYK